MSWDIIGHEEARAFLSQRLQQGRLAHAYLFVGPPGVGKRTLALALAQALNCLGDAPPCGQCSQCRRIASGNHTDVAVLALQEHGREIGIDSVRDLQRTLSLRPFEGRHRVAIVREAERMSREAANALLKTLEEPPDQAVLVLTTADEEALLPTVRSRCQRLQLDPLSVGRLSHLLQETRGVPSEAADGAAAYARGCPGRALAVLDDPGVLDEIDHRITLLKEALAGDVEGRLSQASSLAGFGGAGRDGCLQTLQVWRDWWRDLLLIKTGCPEHLTFPSQSDSYHDLSKSLGVPAIHRVLSRIGQAKTQLEKNANPRLVMDVLLLGLPASQTTR